MKKKAKELFGENGIEEAVLNGLKIDVLYPDRIVECKVTQHWKELEYRLLAFDRHEKTIICKKMNNNPKRRKTLKRIRDNGIQIIEVDIPDFFELREIFN